MSNTGNAPMPLSGTYHGPRIKYARRYLGEFCYRFNRRVDLDRLVDRLAYVILRTPPLPYRMATLDALQGESGLPLDNDFMSVQFLEGMGDAYMALSQPGEAEAAYREMSVRHRGGARAPGPNMGDAHMKLARALAAQGRCDEAMIDLQKAREQAVQFPSDTPFHAEIEKPLEGCAGQTTSAAAFNDA